MLQHWTLTWDDNEMTNPISYRVTVEGDIRWRGTQEACIEVGEVGASSERYFGVGSEQKCRGMIGD